MKKKIRKIIAIIIILNLILIKILPTVAIAAEEVVDVSTSNENINIDAVINGKHSLSADVEEKPVLELDIAVKKTGYLKDIKIELEDNNYELSIIDAEELNKKQDEIKYNEVNNENKETENIDEIIEENINEVSETNTIIENEKTENSDKNINETNQINVINENKIEEQENELVNTTGEDIQVKENVFNDEEYKNKTNPLKKINKNSIELNEIQAGEMSKVKIPIQFVKNKEVKISSSLIDKDSIIKIECTYTNEKGKEKKIKKEITHHLKWTSSSEATIKQEIKKYVKFGDNQTIVGIDINSGIKDNIIPSRNKETTITVPKISEQNPTSVIVTSEAKIEYEYKDEILTIKENKAELQEDGTTEVFEWNSNTKYNIIYIYDKQTNDTVVNSQAKLKVNTLTGEEIEVESLEEFDISNQIGNIVDINVVTPDSINKGYMYTNLKKNEERSKTEYEVEYNIDIGYAEILENISLAEKDYNYLDENKEIIKNANNNIITDKVSVESENLKEILGEDGKIIIKDAEENEIGSLDKDNNELEVKTNLINIETSKVLKEGNLKIKASKEINEEVDYDKEQLKNYKYLSSNSELSYGNDDNDNELADSTIELIEPKSEASLKINKTNLSTVVDNKDVILNIGLKTKDIAHALYENPRFIITLPEQITNIEIQSVNKLYDEELTGKNLQITGNQVLMELDGCQTKYISSGTEDGTIISISMNLELNNLAPSSEELVKLEYWNDTTEDVNQVEIPIEITAPTGMVLTNKIEIEDKSISALKDETENIIIDTNSTSKEMTISGNIINNTGVDVDKVVLMGRIPFAGNKTIDGIDLKSNINTTLKSLVQVDGIDDITIYYSDNGEETADGSTWTTEATSNVKSFKIVKNGIFESKGIFSFKYIVEVPERLDYDYTAKENYGVYYNNNAEEGVSTNLEEAIPLGITTGEAPAITMDVNAIDTNEGYTIDNDGTVKEGEYITYKVKVHNNGSTKAENVSVKTTLPSGITLVKYKEGTESDPIASYFVDYFTKEVVSTIGEVEARETKEIYITAKITDVISNNEENKLTTQFTMTSDLLEEGIVKDHSLKNSKGGLTLKLTSSVTNNFSEGRLLTYLIKLENANYETKGNVEIKLQLPEEIEYTEMGSEYQAEYDSKNHLVTIRLDELKTLPENIMVKATLKTNNDKDIKTIATATYNGSKDEYKSNEEIFESVNINESIQAVQTSNISNSILDTDELEFYVDIRNNTSETKSFIFKDYLPSGVTVKNYKMEVDGQVISDGVTPYIITPVELKAGKSAKATITVNAYTQEKGKYINIKNSPTIVVDDKEIEVNSIELQVNGTGDISNSRAQGTADTNEVTEQTESINELKENIKDSKYTYEEGTYKISGNIWIDENKDGKFEITEPVLQNSILLLYDNDTNQFIKNGDKFVAALTDENGTYTFTNVKPGNYSVMSQYNTREYEIAKYRVEGLSDSENSDFIASKYGETDIAMTDLIEVKDNSIYNINLGLTYREIFDLKLEQNLTKMTVVNQETGANEYNVDSEKGKVQLSKKEMKNSTVLYEYIIKVTNQGDIPGYAKTIVDYIPEDTKFNSELNPDWYIKNDGYAYNSTLVNTLINPGETKELKLVLTKKITEESIGNTRNTAEIYTTYNERGIEAIDAKAGNRMDDENDMASTDAIITTKIEVKTVTTIAFTVLILALIILSVLWITKKFISKMDNDIEKIEGLDK